MAKKTTKKINKTSKKTVPFEPNKMTFAIAGSSVVILFLLALIVTRF